MCFLSFFTALLLNVNNFNMLKNVKISTSTYGHDEDEERSGSHATEIKYHSCIDYCEAKHVEIFDRIQGNFGDRPLTSTSSVPSLTALESKVKQTPILRYMSLREYLMDLPLAESSFLCKTPFQSVSAPNTHDEFAHLFNIAPYYVVRSIKHTMT